MDRDKQRGGHNNAGIDGAVVRRVFTVRPNVYDSSVVILMEFNCDKIFINIF